MGEGESNFRIFRHATVPRKLTLIDRMLFAINDAAEPSFDHYLQLSLKYDRDFNFLTNTVT